jgi:4'-phosphopantetheinyl transferase EntD
MISTSSCIVRHMTTNQLRRQNEALAIESTLHERELHTWLRFRDRRRRDSWLFGRHVAKQLLLELLGMRLGAERPVTADLEIRSRDDFGNRSRPRALLRGDPLPWSLSISHSDHSALAALCDIPGVSVGVDVTPVVNDCKGFLDMWFTAQEQDWVRQGPGPLRTSVLWAVKEAFFKAVNRGEKFFPQRIEVLQRPDDGAFDCRYRAEMFTHRCRVHVAKAGSQIVALVVASSDVVNSEKQK